MMKSNSQSRKWLITLNNPQDINIDLDMFQNYIKGLSPDYYCICKEIAETGTPHFHGFLYSHSPKRFGTLKNVFPTAHFDKAYGTCKENRTYLLKEGVWEDNHKHDTKVEGTFKEEGIMPSERDEKHPELALLIDKVKSGYSTTEILEEFPQYAMQTRNIDELRNAYCAGCNKDKERELRVTYILAPDSFEKISLVYGKHKYKDVCRITNYGTGKGISFDTYHFQKAIVFENFSEQIPLADLNLYLSRYPITLPARYGDRVACYEEVFILSNKHFSELYLKEQKCNPGQWESFIKKIGWLISVNADGEIEEVPLFGKL